MTADNRPPVTPERIMQMAWGFAPPLIIEAGLRNGVFDRLDAGPKTLEEMSSATGASERGLRAIMNALVGIGLLAKTADNRYALTPESAAFLVSGRPSYYGGFLGHASGHLIPSWLELSEIVRAGVNKGTRGGEAAAEFFAEFVEGLFPLSYPATQALAGELRLEGATQPVRVLDIAAGSGVWGIGLAQRSPQVHVTALDWAGVLEVARKMAERSGVAGRFTYVQGDMRSVDFGTGYDIVTIGHVLHVEGVEHSRKLLKKTFDALAPGGTVAIQEFLVNDTRTGPPNALIFAVNMLINTVEGDTWSFDEIAGWLREAGFENPRTIDSPGPSPLILANRPA